MAFLMSDWPEAKIEQLSTSTPADLEEAAAAYKGDAAKEARMLLDAETEEPDAAS